MAHQALRHGTLLAAAVSLVMLAPANASAQSITPDEARAIAKEAYIYGFPMVDNYRIQYAYFVDTKNPEYKAPWNQIINIPRVYTPDDKAIQTPNSDTPYSMVGMDLRAEPMVLTVPPIEKERYFSIQLIDAYTFNFAYIGSRATGNDGGSFLIAGPGWKGETPKGVKKVIRSETELGTRRLSHAAFQSGATSTTSRRSRPATRRSRSRHFSASPRQPPRRRSTSSSRCTLPTSGSRSSSSTS